MATCELLVVAWDGAPPEGLAARIRGGRLPQLAELVKAGAFGRVRSTLPPVTAPAWASFHTGCGPGGHGVFGWAVRGSGGYLPALADAGSLAVPTVWEVLSAHKRVGVVGFPLSHPPRKVRGFWLPGFLAPEGADGHPPGIVAEAKLIAPDWSPTPPEWTPALPPEAWTRELIGGMEAQVRAAIGLAGRYRPAVLALHLQATDTVQHFLWGEEAVEHVFQAADRALGELVEALRPRWVILLSDHGMGPVAGEFHVNTWLLREGFLKLARRPGTVARRALFESGITPRGLTGLGRILYPLARAVGLVKSSADLWGRGAFSRLARGVFLTLADVDWRRTWAYSHSEVGSIYLNRRGREPRGIVGQADARRVLSELAQGLEELRVPGGGPLLGEVVFGREVYGGPQAHLGPDLLFLSRDLRWMGKGLGGFLANRVFTPSAVRAGHRMEGALVISGEGVVRGRDLTGALPDLAPTLLALLGVPIPSWMDGRPLSMAFESGFLRPRYVSQRAPVGQVYGEETVDRLRGYGYL